MTSLDNLLAGSIAGFTSTIITQPFDLVKTRLQVQDGWSSKMQTYNGTLDALSKIGRQEGFRAFYKGLTPNLIGASASWGLFFFWYSLIKDSYAKTQGYSSVDALSGVEKSCCATLSSTGTCILTNPIWLVKTRLQLQVGEMYYRNVGDAFVKIVRDDGARGLFRGLGPSLMMVPHGVIQMGVYEYIRKFVRSEDHMSSWRYLFVAASSKTVASVVTYPFQVIRARIQQRSELVNTRYEGTVDAIRKILSHNGVSGFFKGMVPNLLRVVPNAAVTFFVYENCILFLRNYGAKPSHLVEFASAGTPATADRAGAPSSPLR